MQEASKSTVCASLAKEAFITILLLKYLHDRADHFGVLMGLNKRFYD